MELEKGEYSKIKLQECLGARYIPIVETVSSTATWIVSLLKSYWKCSLNRGMFLYKDELIHIHQLLLYLSKFFMDNGVPGDCFIGYFELGVNPNNNRRTKAQHKHAVFSLALCISDVLCQEEIMPMSMSRRFRALAKRYEKS